jgi:hypothetical protein
MTRPDRADILLRKTRQDELVLERLKALLCARSVDYPRTHSLGVLVELLGTAGETLPGVVGDLNRLTPFGTTFRYDEGFSGLSFDRSDWLATIQSLRAFVEARLNA